MANQAIKQNPVLASVFLEETRQKVSHTTAHKITGKPSHGFLSTALVRLPRTTRTINSPHPHPVQPLFFPEFALAREVEALRPEK
jgi:hypothetical protein